MFDPTVFDNLKVGLENELYDLDNLDRILDITHRSDVLDMAVMSRRLSLRFRLAGRADGASAEIVLDTGLRDLAAELLELEGERAACSLAVIFHMDIEGSKVEEQCPGIERRIHAIWQPERPPVQTLSRVFGDAGEKWSNAVELKFPRRIGEEQMGDIPELIEHAVRTLKELAGLE